MRRYRTVPVLCATLLLAAACASAPADPGPRPGRAPAAKPKLILVDADAHGALLIDAAQRRIVGVGRDGTRAWQAPLDDQAVRPVSCLARCPDAVLSASIASYGSATVPDPEPVLVIGGQRQRLSGLTSAKRQVLTAAGPGDFVVSVGEGTGRWWLEAHHRGAVSRTRVGGSHTSWQESADGRHALAITTSGATPPRNEARWFDRTRRGWRASGPPVPVQAVTSCVRLDGRLAVLLGQRPASLARDGSQRPVTDLPQAGTCALGRTGAVIAELAQDSHGKRSRLRLVDGGGKVTARNDLRTEVVVAADPTAPRVAYLAAGALHELDPRSGKELRTVPGVHAARYDGAGGLVLARDDGTVAWTA